MERLLQKKWWTDRLKFFFGWFRTSDFGQWGQQFLASNAKVYTVVKTRWTKIDDLEIKLLNIIQGLDEVVFEIVVRKHLSLWEVVQKSFKHEAQIKRVLEDTLIPDTKILLSCYYMEGPGKNRLVVLAARATNNLERAR